MHLWSGNLQQWRQEYVVDKTSSVSGAGETGQPHAEKIEYSLTAYIKINTKQIKILEAGNHKLLEVNLGLTVEHKS